MGKDADASMLSLRQAQTPYQEIEFLSCLCCDMIASVKGAVRLCSWSAGLNDSFDSFSVDIQTLD